MLTQACGPADAVEVENAVGEGILDVVRTIADTGVSGSQTGTGATRYAYPRCTPLALPSLHNCHGSPRYELVHTQPLSGFASRATSLPGLVIEYNGPCSDSESQLATGSIHHICWSLKVLSSRWNACTQAPSTPASCVCTTVDFVLFRITYAPVGIVAED